jgi:hypothetical protein
MDYNMHIFASGDFQRDAIYHLDFLESRFKEPGLPTRSALGWQDGLP